MLRLLLMIVVLLVCVSGCVRELHPHYTHLSPNTPAPKREIPVWIDGDFGEADLVGLDDAIISWNYVLNGNIQLNIVSTHFDMEPEILKEARERNGWIILRVLSGSPIVPPSKDGEETTLAFVDEIGTGHMLFLIRDRIDNSNQLKELTMHEIGHLLGAQHLENKSSLMYHHYNHNSFICIDELTVQEVAEYQHLSIKNLNYCEVE